ncbi:putative cysteine-rich receptor-like protein kinase 25 [Sesbania bispinosa]|nr:putative cysteine-rich receptor-like protein kinase 25 [Sesbania bispinosa]
MAEKNIPDNQGTLRTLVIHPVVLNLGNSDHNHGISTLFAVVRGETADCRVGHEYSSEFRYNFVDNYHRSNQSRRHSVFSFNKEKVQVDVSSTKPFSCGDTNITACELRVTNAVREITRCFPNQQRVVIWYNSEKKASKSVKHLLHSQSQNSKEPIILKKSGMGGEIVGDKGGDEGVAVGAISSRKVSTLESPVVDRRRSSSGGAGPATLIFQENLHERI